jgi:AcrR family transcriptional regulator
MDPSMMTVADVARALEVSERTIWRYLKSGRLVGETVGETGAQRTLIPREIVAAVARDRSGADLAGVRAERDRLARMLSAVQAERDALRGRVATLQCALARSERPARFERLVGGALAAVTRGRAA